MSRPFLEIKKYGNVYFRLDIITMFQMLQLQATIPAILDYPFECSLYVLDECYLYQWIEEEENEEIQ